MGLLDDRETLYFFFAHGCAACEAAALELDRFEVKHHAVMVLRLDAAGPYPERFGVAVKATPMWGFRRGQGMVTRVGALKVAELEAWLKKLEARL
jgi:hypothetical protein